MRIEFVGHWQNFQPGQATEALTDGVVDLLVLRKIARVAPATAAPIPETIRPDLADLADVLGAAAGVRPEIPPPFPAAEGPSAAAEPKAAKPRPRR